MEGRTRTAVAAVAALAVVIGLLVLGWIGGELHYRNCLASVELRYPVAYQQPTDRTETQFGIGPQPHFVFHEQAQRDRAISSCSRWP